MNYTHTESPVGRLVIAADQDALRFIQFQTGKTAAPPAPEWEEGNRGIVKETVRQLEAYFRRRLRIFDLPLGPRGTEFQRRVWSALIEIPYGSTISYGELARRVGSPAASRAVGLANGRNPIPIVIPCHRVIGANGKLIGFGGGLPIKETLLALESSQGVLVAIDELALPEVDHRAPAAADRSVLTAADRSMKTLNPDAPAMARVDPSS